MARIFFSRAIACICLTALLVQNAFANQSSIGRHYSHIRICELAYYGNPMGAFEDQLLRESVDLVVPNVAYLAHINSVAPETPQLIYSNLSNLYLDLLTTWMLYADQHGVSREGAFYHVSAAHAFSGDSASSKAVREFWAFARGTTSSSAQLVSSWPKIFGAPGEAFYVAHLDPFREINPTISVGASGGWSFVVEYPTAVDANDAPTTWATLSLLSDTTQGLSTTGQLLFDPPANWKPCSIGGSLHLYFVRFRTTSLSGVPPQASLIYGRDWVGANGGTKGVIPAFDTNADSNGDGYLNDQEYAHRASGFDARFIYESRGDCGYGQMRFATRVANPDFRAWTVAFHQNYMTQMPLSDGVMMDNSGAKPPFATTDVREADVGTYPQDYAATLLQIQQAIAPRWILPNIAGGYRNSEQAPIKAVGSGLVEFMLRPMSNTWKTFLDIAPTVSAYLALTSPPPYIVLDSYPSGGSPTDARMLIGTLAYYYLLADPTYTFLDFYGGYEPGTTWTRHWTAAVGYDVGQPKGAWIDFATGKNPSNPNEIYHVYARDYTNAYIVFKPLGFESYSAKPSLGDETATTHALPSGESYYPLQNDGTLGTVIPDGTVTLRNGEGAILIKGSSLQPSAPKIINQPTNQIVTSGQPATFQVSASGNPSPSYQWQKSLDGGASWNKIDGAINRTYLIPAVAMSDSGAQFRCIVSNNLGSVTSTTALLTVNSGPTLTAPTIVTQPTNRTVSLGQSVTFGVAASGNPAPTYQWQKSINGGLSWNPISGATSPSYVTPATTMNDNSSQFECVISNSQGTVTSSAALLTVEQLPDSSNSPSNGTPSDVFVNFNSGDIKGTFPTGRIHIFSSQGSSVRIFQGPGTIHDLSGLAAGTYFFTVNEKKGSIQKLIIVK